MFILFKHCFVQESNSTKLNVDIGIAYCLSIYWILLFISCIVTDKQTIHSGFCISMTGLCKNFSLITNFLTTCWIWIEKDSQLLGHRSTGGRLGVLVAGLLLWGLWSGVARASQLHGGHSAGCEAVLGAGGLGPHPWLVLGLPACLLPLVPWHSCPWLWELCPASLSPCWGGRTCVIGMCGLRFSMLLWGRGCWGLQEMLLWLRK